MASATEIDCHTALEARGPRSRGGAGSAVPSEDADGESAPGLSPGSGDKLGFLGLWKHHPDLHLHIPMQFCVGGWDQIFLSFVFFYQVFPF